MTFRNEFREFSFVECLTNENNLKIQERKRGTKRKIWDRLQVLEWLLQSIQVIQPLVGMENDKDWFLHSDWLM